MASVLPERQSVNGVVYGFRLKLREGLRWLDSDPGMPDFGSEQDVASYFVARFGDRGAEAYHQF